MTFPGYAMLREVDQLVNQRLAPSRITDFEKDDALRWNRESADPVSAPIGTLVPVEEVLEVLFEMDLDGFSLGRLEPRGDFGPLFADSVGDTIATSLLATRRVDKELDTFDLECEWLRAVRVLNNLSNLTAIVGSLRERRCPEPWAEEQEERKKDGRNHSPNSVSYNSSISISSAVHTKSVDTIVCEARNAH
jgi:hypothetical protein